MTLPPHSALQGAPEVVEAQLPGPLGAQQKKWSVRTVHADQDAEQMIEHMAKHDYELVLVAAPGAVTQLFFRKGLV